MKCKYLFFVIFLASVFLFATFGLEAEGGTARTELEKKGCTYFNTSPKSIQKLQIVIEFFLTSLKGTRF